MNGGKLLRQPPPRLRSALSPPYLIPTRHLCYPESRCSISLSITIAMTHESGGYQRSRAKAALRVTHPPAISHVHSVEGRGEVVNRGISGIVLVGAIDANLSTVASSQLSGSNERPPFPFIRNSQFLHFPQSRTVTSFCFRRGKFAALPLNRSSPLRLRSAGIFFIFCFVNWIFPPPSSLCRECGHRASKRKGIFFSLPLNPAKPG